MGQNTARLVETLKLEPGRRRIDPIRWLENAVQSRVW